MTSTPPPHADDGLEAMMSAVGDIQDGGAGHAPSSSGPMGGHGDGEVPIEDLIPQVARGQNSALYGYDIAQMKERPWAQPGANLSDYFNYDFDEATYRAFCAMHAQGPNSLKLRAEDFANKILMHQAPGPHQQFQHQAPQQQVMVQPSSMPMLTPAPMLVPPAEGETRYIPRHILTKTRPCYAFRDGLCTKGTHCIYAHGDQEMHQAKSMHYQMREAGYQLPPHQPTAERRPYEGTRGPHVPHGASNVGGGNDGATGAPVLQPPAPMVSLPMSAPREGTRDHPVLRPAGQPQMPHDDQGVFEAPPMAPRYNQ
jgi:hypothetical protein